MYQISTHRQNSYC